MATGMSGKLSLAAYLLLGRMIGKRGGNINALPTGELLSTETEIRVFMARRLET
jgi:hypothetical protein